METLVVMDFSKSTVDVYNISVDAKIDEEWFNKKGYNINTIYYMFTKELNINFISE